MLNSLRLLIILALLIFPLGLKASDDLLEQATRSLENNDYQKSIELYESYLQKNKNAPLVYFNAAFAASKNNDIAKAVYYYRKALFLNPNFIEARENLSLVEPEINQINQSSPQTLLQVSFVRTPSIMWVCLAQSSVIVLILFLLFKKQNNEQLLKQRLTLLPLITAVFVTTGVFLLHQNLRTENIDAIVMSNDAILRAGPGLTYPESTDLEEGTNVKFLGRPVDAWIKVKAPDGLVGYLPIDVLKSL